MPPITEKDFKWLYAAPSGSGTTTNEGYFAVIGENAYFTPDEFTTPSTNQISSLETEMREAGIKGEVDEAGRIIGMSSTPPKILMYTARRGDDPEITRKTITKFQGISGEHVLFERRPK